MIITGILTAAVTGLLFYGILPTPYLAMLCAVSGVSLAALGRHSHGGTLAIDMLAQRSRLNEVNGALKVWGSLTLLVLCVAMNSVAAGIVLTLVALCLTVFWGKLPLHDYLSLLSLPGAFMLISGLALLFSYERAPVGVLNLNFFGGYLSVTAASQATTLLVMAKALGAVSCLYLMSLSTPLTEMIGVLRRAHIPPVVAELMYLIYRYIFILLDMYRTMHDAAESRLGYYGFSRSLKTTGEIYGNMLARSFQKANACFDAMESRCYEGEIRFLEDEKPLRCTHALTGCTLFVIVAAMGVWGRIG